MVQSTYICIRAVAARHRESSVYDKVSSPGAMVICRGDNDKYRQILDRECGYVALMGNRSDNPWRGHMWKNNVWMGCVVINEKDETKKGKEDGESRKWEGWGYNVKNFSKKMYEQNKSRIINQRNRGTAGERQGRWETNGYLKITNEWKSMSMYVGPWCEEKCSVCGNRPGRCLYRCIATVTPPSSTRADITGESGTLLPGWLSRPAISA